MEQVTTATVEAILKEEQARADELKAIAARIVTICDRFDDNLEDITLDLNANGFDPKEILRVVGSRAGAFDSKIRAEIDSLIETSLDSVDGNDESSEWHVSSSGKLDTIYRWSNHPAHSDASPCR